MLLKKGIQSTDNVTDVRRQPNRFTAAMNSIQVDVAVTVSHHTKVHYLSLF